jgi:hypothetical protein
MPRLVAVPHQTPAVCKSWRLISRMLSFVQGLPFFASLVALPCFEQGILASLEHLRKRFNQQVYWGQWLGNCWLLVLMVKRTLSELAASDSQQHVAHSYLWYEARGTPWQPVLVY